METENNGKRKRILIFSTAYLPHIGGAELSLRDMLDNLPEYEFDLICAKLKKGLKSEEQVGGARVFRIGRGSKIDKFRLPLFGALKGLRLHRQKKYDGLWSVSASRGSLAALFFKWRHPEVPFLFTSQNGQPVEEIRRKFFLISPVFNQIFKKVDYLHSASTYLEKVARELGVTAKGAIVPNAVNLKKFRLSPEVRANFRKETRAALGLSKDDIVIVSVGRLAKKNGLADLIKSAVLVKGIKILLPGGGELESELKKLAQELGVGDRVIFPGSVDHAQVPRYLAAADIFCRPSLSEGLGSVFLEAMVAGLPVLATPVGGIPDFLVDGRTGLFVKVNNPEDLAEKIEKLIKEPELRERLIKNGEELVLKEYGIGVIIEKTRRLLKEFLKVKLD